MKISYYVQLKKKVNVHFKLGVLNPEMFYKYVNL